MIHPIKTSSGFIVSDPSAKAEIFNQYFISVFTPDDGQILPPPYPPKYQHAPVVQFIFQLQV